AGPGESDTPEIREDGASISPRHAGLLEMRTSRPDIYFSFFMFTADLQPDVANYTGLKERLDKAGVGRAKIATNVGTTRTFDPTSPYPEQRDAALAYLKSRVDITVALGGTMMAGPVVFPYGVYPTTDANQGIWSDALQDWVVP